ncbi:MAG: tetratricopeptide repeat protein, partial [Candidatus Aminicenantaceae bacterium]
YNNLAYSYGYMKNRSEVTAAARKYIALHPDTWNAYHSGWEAHIVAGMYDEAIQIMEEAREKWPDYLDRISSYIGRSHLLKGELGKAREIFRQEQRPWYMCITFLFEGKYNEAYGLIDGIVKSAQKEKNLSREWTTRIQLALILALQKKYEKAMEEIAKAEELTQKAFGEDHLSRSIILDYINGLVLIKKGDYETAKSKAEYIKKKIQDKKLDIILMDYYNLLLAELFIAQNEGQMASGVLEKFTGSASLTSAHYWHIVARIHELQGNWDEAIETYLKSYSNTQLTYWGISDPFYFYWSASLFDYRVGILYAKKGDVAKAIEHLGKFVERWKNADPGIAEFENAQKRLVVLKNAQ